MFASDIKHKSPALQEKLHKLYALNRGNRIELSFRKPYLDLLKAFGDPHLSLPPVIHVAGTNGKGSTIAFLRAFLEAAGYKVHVYTSPHLIEFNERIVLAGQTIDDQTLETLIDEALEYNNGADTTFFEITTAIAFAAFARTPADICLIEVGLGGRLDCTNVIESPAATIITSIGHDHHEFLGDTVKLIASEKAGIMKSHAPCIIAPQSGEAVNEGILEVFINQSKTIGCNILQYGTDWKIKTHKKEIVFECGAVHMHLPEPNLSGPHQIANMGTALAALCAIQNRFTVSRAHIEAGLKNVHWPARLQKLSNSDFNLPPQWELWLDGGHNQDAAAALAAQALLWQNEDPKPLHIILGMMHHKDAQSFWQPLQPYAHTLSITDIEDEPGAMKAEEITEILENPKQAATYPSFKHAITHIIKSNHAPGRILICGSLYLAGQVLQNTGLETNRQ